MFECFKGELLIEGNPSKYFFINQGVLAIDRVDDAQEMRDTKKAFDILGFTQVIITGVQFWIGFTFRNYQVN